MMMQLVIKCTALPSPLKRLPANNTELADDPETRHVTALLYFLIPRQPHQSGTYQIGNYAGRPCVVISPLIALMEDQVAALNARGVKAAFLGSAQTSSEV